jgi:hypothetical protein
VGIAMEIGIEPTARLGADLGYIPVVVRDACGFGHRDAAARSIASLEFVDDSLLTNVETICAQFQRIHSQQVGQGVTERVFPVPVQRTCPDSDVPDRSGRAGILVRQEPDEEEEEEDHNDGEEDSDDEDGNDDGYSE